MSNPQRQPRLLVRGLSGPVMGRTWIVEPERALELGRGVESTNGVEAVAIPDAHVSYRHCRIEHVSGVFRAVDLNSTNGFRINGQPIERGSSAVLGDGDVLSLAGVALRVQFESEASHAPSEEDELGKTMVSVSELRSPDSSVIHDLIPFPIAMGIRKVRQALVALDRVQEVLRSFEVMLQFQVLVALSEYSAGTKRTSRVSSVLNLLRQRPLAMGKWIELYGGLRAALSESEDLVVEELGQPDDGTWKKAAGRLLEIRNDLFHSGGLSAEAADAVGGEISELYNSLVSGLGYWMGYRFIFVEPGTWHDDEQTFRYPCRVIVGYTVPFESRVLKSPSCLPARVPIIIGRDNRKRLSLAPFQAILAGEDKQLHWFMVNECARNRAVLGTYPASFRATAPIPDLLSEEFPTSNARADFVGTFEQPQLG